MTIRERKADHLRICRDGPAEFQSKTAWFEHVELVHQALPTVGAHDLDTSIELLGRRLAAPFIIGAMTGGTEDAGRINRDLAAVAQEKGVGFALGSQRPMLERDELVDTYRVRDVAPDILLLGNIGLAQAVRLEPENVLGLIDAVSADGMCLHLNTAMEIFQQEGDDIDGGGDAAIARLSAALGTRLIVKETGCGISRETALRLAHMGLSTLDVAGAGGASWVRIENLRAGGASEPSKSYEEWGIPTAASLLEVRGLRMSVIAGGGLRSGLHLAKAIALGASAGSAALPILRVYYQGGKQAAGEWIDRLIEGLRTAMLLTGCRDLKALRHAPVVLLGPLGEWAVQRGLWRKKE